MILPKSRFAPSVMTLSLYSVKHSWRVLHDEDLFVRLVLAGIKERVAADLSQEAMEVES